MSYPTIGEYKDAIRLAEHSFGSLTHLRPEYDDTGDLHFSSGNFAVVFKMRDTRTDRPVAVKCFLREQPLRHQRYQQISACLDALPYSPYLLDYTYYPSEIWVETALSEQREFEVVTLDWIEGQTLYKYLQSYCDAGDTHALQQLAKKFDRMAMWLLEQPFAHGDLKPDNILVTPYDELVLVDYDGMFTPDMQGQEATELGSPAFRHPRRSLRDFGKHIDYVPILVLSLSLHVLTEHPDWLETYCQGDNLILTANELTDSESLIFHTIRTQCRAWTTQNRLLGLVNALMLPTLVAMPPVYLKSVPDYDEVNLIPYVKYFKDGSKKWGYCDEHKNLVIDFIYDDVNSFSEGFAQVKRDGKYGFVDTTGQEVTPCIYDYVYEFHEGFAQVNRDGKYGFVDTTGQEVTPCIYDYLERFSEGFAQVKKDGKCGFIDKTGQEVIPRIYNKVLLFNEGFACVDREGDWGFVDKTGKEFTPCIYDYVGYFHKGFAVVGKGFDDFDSGRKRKYGFVDTTGQEVIPCIYDNVKHFYEGLVQVNRKGKWGFVDSTGQEVTPCIYDIVGNFYEGLANVTRDGKWGFVNTTGREVVPCIYNDVINFEEGLALVNRNYRTFYINKQGIAYFLEE